MTRIQYTKMAGHSFQRFLLSHKQHIRLVGLPEILSLHIRVFFYWGQKWFGLHKLSMKGKWGIRSALWRGLVLVKNKFEYLFHARPPGGSHDRLFVSDMAEEM